jgi:hypothetical protein
MQTAFPPKSPFYRPDPSAPVPESPEDVPDVVPGRTPPLIPEADPVLAPEVDDVPDRSDDRADVIEPGLDSPTDDDAPAI